MRILFIILLQALLAFGTCCQTPQWKKPRYLAKIKDKSENFILTGALYNVTDSSVILTCSSCKAVETERFQIEIKFRKMNELIVLRNSPFNNWLISGSILGAVGFTYAYMKYKDMNELNYPFTVYPAAFFAIGAMPFVIMGVLMGTMPKTSIIIDQELQKFASNKDLIKKYCFIQ